ncbi:MAG: ATP-binding protein, partial [Mariprofundus sp.]|nr:ATP-binding protein [Mariprofundus sp.]
IRSKDRSGNILKLLCTAICMRWHNRWIGVCFVLDISEREAMQKELESVHREGYMSTLVAGIVHDFRNVLTNMIGNAEVLQMSTQDKSSILQLNAIIAAGERGSELITHLLELSKSHKKNSISGCTEGPLVVKRLENIISLARLQMPPYIQLNGQVDTPLHDVAISMIEIEQILINLINNAAQAIDKSGQIHVHICSYPEHRLSRPGHPCMRIHVTDNGSGILDEDMDNVFEAFWTSKSSQGGTGLGLTTVQQIIKRNHGSIEVESIPNQKTRFIIHLPPYIPESNTTTVKENKRATSLNEQEPPT